VKITGLDLSLKKTGIAHAYIEPVRPEVPLLQDARPVWATTCRIAPAKRLGEGHERLDFLLQEVGQHVQGSDLVLLEGLAFSQSTNQASQLAGLHWYVRHALWRAGKPYVVVITQHLKIYATGHGTRVDKDDVLAAMIKRYPDVEIAGNDGADALACAALGTHYLGFPLRPVPQTHSRALEMMTWPERVQEMKEVTAQWATR
jgi:crossover junction endodeoxyribonuclease RuvC